MATKSDNLITAGVATQSGSRADMIVFTLPVPVNRAFVDSGSLEAMATQNNWSGGTTAQAAAFIGQLLVTYFNQQRAQSLSITNNIASSANFAALIAAQVT